MGDSKGRLQEAPVPGQPVRPVQPQRRPRPGLGLAAHGPALASPGGPAVVRARVHLSFPIDSIHSSLSIPARSPTRVASLLSMFNT